METFQADFDVSDKAETGRYETFPIASRISAYSIEIHKCNYAMPYHSSNQRPSINHVVV